MRALLTIVALLLTAYASSADAACRRDRDCLDGNICTVDRCDRTTRECTHVAGREGTSCSDNSRCTRGDFCQAGTCTPKTTVTCPASDSCHAPSTCNPQSGRCSAAELPDGTACNDYDLCTQTDTCDDGECLGSNPLECAPIDECHFAGECNPNTGVCTNPPKNPLVCAPVGQCNVAGSCDPESGACSTPLKADGLPCNDGDACTLTDACTSGACVGINPVVCDTSNSCATDIACDSVTGACRGETLPDGTECTSGTGTACSLPDTCEDGVCNVGGGGDADGDTVCDLDDNCPDAIDATQMDTDGDGMGDACDPEDGQITLLSVKVKSTKPEKTEGGGVAIRGTLSAAEPDVFGTSSGLSVRLTDGVSIDQSADFDASECKTSRKGRIRCRQASDPATRAKFAPQRKTPGLYKMRIRLAHLPILAPFSAPITVTVTDDGMTDRVGTIADCTATTTRLQCGIL